MAEESLSNASNPFCHLGHFALGEIFYPLFMPSDSILKKFLIKPSMKEKALKKKRGKGGITPFVGVT